MKKFKSKVKEFFSNRRNVIAVISVVSFLILALVGVFFWLIYAKDEPGFVPEETKGVIRKGIEENVGGNVQKVAPGLGQAIIDASFDNKQDVASTETAGNQLKPDVVDPTAGWLEYKGSSGYILKYPGDWIVEEGNVPAILPRNSSENGLFLYSYSSNLDPFLWWGQDSKKYAATYTVSTEAINGYQVTKAVEVGGLGEIHYVFRSEGKIIDALLLGYEDIGSQIIQTLK